MSETVSFAAFGRSKGVTRQAVQKGFRSGRLSRSIGRDPKGRPCIANVALASSEWDRGVSQMPNDGRRSTKNQLQAKMPLVPASAFAVLSGGTHVVIVRVGESGVFEDALLWPISRSTARALGLALVAKADQQSDDFDE